MRGIVVAKPNEPAWYQARSSGIGAIEAADKLASDRGTLEPRDGMHQGMVVPRGRQHGVDQGHVSNRDRGR